MPIDVIFDAELGFLRVTLTGRWPTLPEQVDEREKARRAGFLQGDTPALIDLRGITGGLPQPDEVRLAIAAARQSEGWARRRALLVATEAQREAAEVFVALASPNLAVFTDENEATSWIACLAKSD